MKRGLKQDVLPNDGLFVDVEESSPMKRGLKRWRAPWAKSC